MGNISSDNIINRVSIEPTVECAWIDALADISKNIRFKKGIANAVITINQETARLKGNGVLTLSIAVDGTQVEMDIPSGMWSWQQDAVAGNISIGASCPER